MRRNIKSSRYGEYFSAPEVKESRRVRGRKVTSSRSQKYSDYELVGYDTREYFSYPEFFHRLNNIYKKDGVDLRVVDWSSNDYENKIQNIKIYYQDNRLDGMIDFTIDEIPIIRRMSGIDYDAMLEIAIEKISDAIAPYLSKKIFDDSYKSELANALKNIKFSRRVRGRKVTASKRNRRRPIMSSVEVIDGVKFDFWYDNTFDDVCDADCRFYPNGGYYAGNIYDCSGKIIGDYTGTDSVAIERLFPGIFGD